MAKKIELKELASAFGMNVGELADYLGYTRQGLYNMNNGITGICTRRYHATLKLLKVKSDEIYQKDMNRAATNKIEREYIISKMCENVNAINVVEQTEQIRIKEKGI